MDLNHDSVFFADVGCPFVCPSVCVAFSPKDCVTRLHHHITEKMSGIPTKCFRQLRKGVTAGESYSLWCVRWAFVTLQTVHMYKKLCNTLK